MNVVLCIISVMFGGLSLIAAISQMRAGKKSLPAILMIVGSVILVSAVICNLAKLQFDYVPALIGCMAICAAAICNGLKSGNFHVKHHVIRIILSLILIVGFALL